ncbi:MAG: Ig-like domain-containing protein [Lachnospiraceae bacterium]|nr:Ig-like domain-containing protein [Lachnospiraceae bacterium]
MSKKKKRRLKKSVKYSMAAGGIALAVIGVTILGSKGKAPKPEPVKSVTTTSSILTDEQVKELLKGDAPVIQMDDFKISQGEQIVVTSTPGEGVLRYASTNEDVVIVEDDGTITAVAPGVAAITVTSGTKTDSVIVEVVEHQEDKGTSNLPLYTDVISNVVVEPNIPKNDTTVVSDETTTKAATQSTVQPITQPVTQSQTVQSTTKASEQTTKSQDIPVVTDKLYSIDLYDYLESFGFVKKLGNAYIYSKVTDADAQVIIENKCTHIYLKDSNLECVSALKKVVALLLPESFEDAMDKLLHANGDSYYVMDGRGVQVIARKESEHRQIIIYN